MTILFHHLHNEKNLNKLWSRIRVTRFTKKKAAQKVFITDNKIEKISHVLASKYMFWVLEIELIKVATKTYNKAMTQKKTSYITSILFSSKKAADNSTGDAGSLLH